MDRKKVLVNDQVVIYFSMYSSSESSSSSWSSLNEEFAHLNPKLTKGSTSDPYSIARAHIFENRYCDVLPSNSNIVRYRGKYFNASRYQNYILSQCPLHLDISKFWGIVQQEEVKTVVCLVPSSELDCDYFSSLNGKVIDQDDLFTIRNIKVNDKEITHVHVTGWIDDGTITVTDLTRIVDLVLPDPRDPPNILVHCLAGIGRTGTMVAACLLRERPDAEVEDLVRTLRQARWGCVRTEHQYSLLKKFKECVQSK